MSKKLSELKNEDMLIVKNTGGGDIVLTKEDLINDLDYYKGISNNLQENIYTTIQYKANIQAYDMLEVEIENESERMYECWDFDIKRAITDDDLEEIQKVIDRILSRVSNICYTEDKKVEFDL